MKIRQHLIIILFFLITIGLSGYSYLGNFDRLDNPPEAGAVLKNDESDESYFKVVEYYLLNNGTPLLQLESSDLTISQKNSVILGFNPNGVIYRKNSKGEEIDPILFNSKSMRGLMANKELYLWDEVEIKLSNSSLKSNTATIFNNGKHIEASGNVKTTSMAMKTNDQLFIDSEFVLYRPEEEFFEYQRNVKGLIQRKRKYEEDIRFTTDLLTLSAPASLVEMKGRVTLNKGNLDASSNRGTVFLENYNKKLKYYSLSDDVRLQETLKTGGKPVIRKAFSEKLEGLISEKKIILTGLPKVFQGKDVIKGNRIIIRENVESVEVDDANTNITLEREEKKI